MHGAWIPGAADTFQQDGDFYLWVETSEPACQEKTSRGGRSHPRHLSAVALQSFLDEKLGLRPEYGAVLSSRVAVKSFLLPTADGAPLPSTEMLPYTEAVVPDSWEFAPWSICCFPLEWPIVTLNEIHFLARHAAEDFHLGADLLFWWQFTQVVKTAITSDHYIPSLKYRFLPPAERKGNRSAFALYPGWELVSPAYETAIGQYAAAMPRSCSTGVDGKQGTELFTPETLLRHCAEHLVHRVIAGVPTTAKFDLQIRDSILYDCVYRARPIPGSGPVLDEYKKWASWRGKLMELHASGGFTLCFRLEEARAHDPDDWHIHFLLASKRDPSFKVSLAEYWALNKKERDGLRPHFGADFERHLLLALGQAARMYTKIWKGLETSQPVDFRLTLEEACAFLQEQAWLLEDAGFTVIVPAWCTPAGRRRARLRLKTAARSGSSGVAKSYFSLDTVIAYEYQLSIGGEAVTNDEWRQLVEAKTPLVQFRGQWVQLDRDHMQKMLELWHDRQQTQPEMTLQDLLKVAAADDDDLEWEHDGAVEDVLSALREQRSLAPAEDLTNFEGTLREYQKQGVAWLRSLESVGLNPCLADDMGLGKTVQVIAQLVAERNALGEVPPTLLVVPTSVLGNWRKEIERFAPHLRVLVHQGSTRLKEPAAFRAACGEHDAIVTSFALARLDEKLLRLMEWRRIVVDEAQNIKNPQSAQTRAIMKLTAQHRLALTGTPVENRLRDLWSLFNFLNPGYLGKEAQFRRAFELPIQRDNDVGQAAALRKLVEPFILRRLKTDKRIIDDLPDKIEQKVYCNLTAEQASLYQAVVTDVDDALDGSEGIERKGLILATLTKLKQVCNHPAQFLQDGSEFSGERSLKLLRLAEMLEEIVANGESALIFTQFTEMGAGLERYLGRGRHLKVCYLHGGTSVKKREQMVAAFQDPDSPPMVFILSVRAGGTGLTLTKANHVFHFDRWWNPAVEDQATDRAFRIGQRKNVFAHKFVTIGTLEERIDQMIEDKRRLAATIVGADESWLTELDNESFKDLIALRRSAIVE
ncbi:MAG: DEAD/DEAH box helicase [Chloroflexota bacterium]